MTGEPSGRSSVDRLPEPSIVALVLAIAIVFLGVAGAIVGTEATPGQGPASHSPFHLVNEKTIPTFFTGAVLATGGLCSLLAGRLRVHGEHGIWLAFGVLLILMGIDEVAQIHERVETWTGVDWQQPYAVVVVGAAFVWWRLLKALDRVPRVLLVAGAAAWAVSFALEDLEYNSSDERVAGFAAMAVGEEVLEMAGATLFLLAVLVAVKRQQRLAHA